MKARRLTMADIRRYAKAGESHYFYRGNSRFFGGDRFAGPYQGAGGIYFAQTNNAGPSVKKVTLQPFRIHTVEKATSFTQARESAREHAAGDPVYKTIPKYHHALRSGKETSADYQRHAKHELKLARADEKAVREWMAGHGPGSANRHSASSPLVRRYKASAKKHRAQAAQFLERAKRFRGVYSRDARRDPPGPAVYKSRYAPRYMIAVDLHDGDFTYKIYDGPPSDRLLVTSSAKLGDGPWSTQDKAHQWAERTIHADFHRLGLAKRAPLLDGGEAAFGAKEATRHERATGRGTTGRDRPFHHRANASAPSQKKQKWIAEKIHVLRHEGYPERQAIAIAYRMAGVSRKKS